MIGSHFRRTIRHFSNMRATFARSEVAAGPIDLLHIADLHERFAPHMHEAYAIGVFVSGSYRLRCAGVEHVTAPGSVVALPPGVIHSGVPADDEGWTTRMFYPDERLFRAVTFDDFGARDFDGGTFARGRRVATRSVLRPGAPPRYVVESVQGVTHAD